LLDLWSETGGKEGIGPEEYVKRSKVALIDWQETLDTKLPLIKVSMDKILILPELTQAITTFTDTMKQAFDVTAHESGAFGKNLIRNILTALEDRAIFNAIEEIGAYLAQTLTKASSGNGIWSEIITGVLGAFGPSSGGGGEPRAAAASGGFVAAGQTYGRRVG
jgi:hypothetical protein